MMLTVTIHNGPHYTDKVMHSYKTIGHIDHIKAGAIVHIMQRTNNTVSRHWVDVHDNDGAPITHWILDNM